MKLGISMWSYYAAWKRGELDIPGFIHESKRLGADGVELLDFFWKDQAAEMPTALAALRETGLACGVYSVSNNFALADPTERAVQEDIIRQGVDGAHALGAHVVRVFAGNPATGMDLSDVFDWIVSSFQNCVGYAADHGVTLALENHGLLAGRSEQVGLILQAVDSPALRANPDTGNFLLVHEASHEAVAHIASLAAMAHFKDFAVVPDDYTGSAYQSADGVKFAGRAIGEGDVDLAGCLAALRHAGFDGWLNIEYEAEEDPMTGVPRSVTNTKTLLETA